MSKTLIHKAKFILGGFFIVCGIPRGKKTVGFDWTEVTCEKCLALHPRRKSK